MTDKSLTSSTQSEGRKRPGILARAGLLGVAALALSAFHPAMLLGIGLHGKVDVNVAASPDAQRLRVSEIALAELEVRLEDSLRLAQQ